MSEIICYTGVIGSGKGHQSNLLINKGYVSIDFADELRAIAWDIIGYIPKNYDKAKECVVGLDHLPIFVSRVLKFFFPKLLTIRELLQNLGTEAMRSRDADYWCKLWSDKVEIELAKGNNVVCSDMRFPNEMIYSQDVGAKIIFCNYKSDRYNAGGKHESERMAQYLLKKGYEDLKSITNIPEFLNEYLEIQP